MKNVNMYQLKKLQSEFPMQKISVSKDAADFARKFWTDIDIFESFFLLTLNRANKTTGYVKISQGGICATVVDPILIAKYSIESLAKAVILLHNHPSGQLTPSDQDRKLTERIKNGLSLFDITVLDHIILTEEGYYSMQDNGLM